MFDLNQSLLPIQRTGILPVALLGFESSSMDEMKRLLDTLGAKSILDFPVKLRNINPATYVGTGKLEELKEQIEATKNAAEEVVKQIESGELILENLSSIPEVPLAVIIDGEVSPNQLRNIEKIFGIPTIDRPGVILEIFSRHARTKESKTQVEIAKLEYLLPRLAHYWTHFERQRGGIGNKGMGETQIEVDRRLVKKRMAILRDRLKEIENERRIQRSARKNVLKVALVGYTNAGKSTLLNALTHSDVLAEDKLFATLDPSVRMLDPHCHPPLVAIDTVGFISQLPHSLVASFRSTLEELHEADLLIHVVDSSSAQAKEQIEVTNEVLKELGLEDKPKMMVLNKADFLKTQTQKMEAKLLSPGAQLISSLNEQDVNRMRDLIISRFKAELVLYEVLIPYSEGKVESLIHQYGSIEVKRFMEKGTFYKVRMSENWGKKLELEKFQL